MQIVGAPCVKAGPSANGKHPAARLSDVTVDGMVVNDVHMSHMFYMGSLKQWHGGECCQHDPSGVPSPPREAGQCGFAMSQLVYHSPFRLVLVSELCRFQSVCRVQDFSVPVNINTFNRTTC